MDARIFHIKEKLSQSVSEAWSVGRMAAEVKMSIPRFQQLFKLEVGLTPIAYLSDLRLETARKMLADPECFMQVKEIRFQIGFKNDSHFTQDFKVKNGMTPTQYRQRQADIHQAQSRDGYK